MEIREMRPEEWRLFRDARLRALQGAPDAFGNTYAEALALTDEQWEAQFRQRAATTTYLVAPAAAGGFAGIAQLFVVPAEPAVGHIAGMWVEAEHRRAGVAARLLDACLSHARRRGMERVQLHVTEGNDGARRLYEGGGFVLTGQWEPLREESELRVLEMERDL